MKYRSSRTRRGGYRPRHAAPGQPRREKVLDRAEDVTVLAGAVNTVADLGERVAQLVQSVSQWLG